MPTTQEIEDDKVFLTGIFANAGINDVTFRAIRQNHGKDLECGIQPGNVLTLDPSRPITFDEQDDICEAWDKAAQSSWQSGKGEHTNPSLGTGRLLMIWESEPDSSSDQVAPPVIAHPLFMYREHDRGWEI